MLVLLAALFLTPLLQRGLPFAPSTLRRTSGRATMTIAGVAGTPYVAVGEHARARRTGFSHRVGAPTVRGCGLYTGLGRAFVSTFGGAWKAFTPRFAPNLGSWHRCSARK
jgi:hypothetical protein